MKILTVLFLMSCIVFVHCTPRPEQKSLVIVFDSTGSMFDNLQQLTASATNITNYLSNSQEDLVYNYILVKVFNDPILVLNTRNKDELLMKLKTLKIGHGGDCPELILTGILGGIQAAEPQSFVFVFTDASAKDYYLNKTVIRLVQEKQITLTFYVTGICNDRMEDLEVYQLLAEKSNGQLFYLVNDEKTPALDDILEKFMSKNLIYHEASSDAGNKVLHLDIDNETESITSTLNGKSPNLHAYDPTNMLYNVVDSKSLENSLTITINNPTPGRWKFKYKSTSAHTVKVIGVGNLNFHYGFSRKKPFQLEDTILTPLAGDNVLSIFPTNSSLVKNLTEVIISGKAKKDNHPEYALLLKKSTIGRQVFYFTNFKPIYPLFKILVCGFDIQNFPIKRMLSTELTYNGVGTANISLPEVSSKDSYTIFEGEDFILACEGSTRTDVTVQWKRENTILKENSFPPGFFKMLYIIKNAHLSNYGDYYCHAKNSDGIKVSKTTLQVKKIQFEVKIPEDNYRIKLDHYAEIECLINIDHKFKIKWHFNDIAYKPWEDGNEFNRKCVFEKVTTASSGKYTCFIKIGNTIKSASAVLTVVGTKQLAEVVIETDYDKPVFINCTALGTPPPKIKWSFINLNDETTYFDLNRKQYIIPKFKRESRGDYICEVDNGYEIQLETFIVTGRVYKPIIDTTYSNKITAIQAKNVEILCACDNCYPVTRYSWSCNIGTITAQSPQTQNNMIASRVDKVDKFTNGTFVYKLTIKEIYDDDECVCKLQNSEGSTAQIFEITVNSPPTYDYEDNNDKCTKIFEGVGILEISCKINEGGTLTLDCEMQGHPEPDIMWLYNGIVLTEYDVTLELKSITQNEKGVYTCKGTNTVSVMTIVYQVIVLYKPEIVETNFEYDDYKFIFHCSAIGYPTPTIEWKSNGKLLLSSSKIENNEILEKSLNYYKRIYFDAAYDGHLNDKFEMIGFMERNIMNDNNVTLSLYEKTDEKSKRYQCIASNDMGRNSKEIILTQMPPSFVTDLAYTFERVIPYNISFKLSCKSSGYPTPTVFWYKNNMDFDYDKNDNIFFSDNKQILNFNKSDVNDNGNYFCIVKNWLGAIRRDFNITVFYPPILNGYTNSPTIFLNVNEELKIDCHLNGNPIPTYMWSQIDSPGNESIIGDNKILLIEKIKESCKFKCFAANFIGDNYITYDVKVSHPPEFIYKKDIHLKVKYKGKVDLNCELSKGSESFTYPKIAWFKDGSILEDSDINHHVSRNKQILTTLLNRYDATYSCLVKNKLGKKTKNFFIVIET